MARDQVVKIQPYSHRSVQIINHKDFVQIKPPTSFCDSCETIVRSPAISTIAPTVVVMVMVVAMVVESNPLQDQPPRQRNDQRNVVVTVVAMVVESNPLQDQPPRQ